MNKKQKKTFKKRSANLLSDPHFSNCYDWKLINADCNSDFIVHECSSYEDQDEVLTRPVLRIYSYATFEGRGLFQEIDNLQKGRYVFEVELCIWKECFGTKFSGVYLRVVSDEQVVAETRHLRRPDRNVFYLKLPFELSETGAVQLQICVDGVGTVYAKSAKLQRYY